MASETPERRAAGARPSAEQVSPALAPPPGNPRFPLLDSLRAVAALSVVVYHVGFFTHTQQEHGYGALMASLGAGVTVFFVLSGFLLFRPMFNADMTGAPRARLGLYARRRILRILPAYWLALTVLAIWPGLPAVFSEDWWRYYFFLQIYDDGLHRIAGLAVAWSLCIEVAFYAALPLYAFVSQRLSRNLASAGKVRLQLACLTLLALGAIAVGPIRQGEATGPSLLSFFDWFAWGMALAVVSVALAGRRRSRAAAWVARHPAACWAAALATYLLLSLIVASAPLNFQYSDDQAIADHVLRGLLAFLIVLPAVVGGDARGWPRRLLGTRPLRWLGEISYGIYLWHLPLLLWMVHHGVTSPALLLPLTLAWTIACAAASYYLVERPILRFKDGGVTWRRLRTTAARPRGRPAPEQAVPTPARRELP